MAHGALEQPTRDPAALLGAALAALERTAYEDDGRGVAMVGVAFTLPPAPATDAGGR